MGGQGGLPATPPDQEVGMSDDAGDDHPRAPLKPGLHVSRHHGLLGQSTPHGGGDGERLRQGSESTAPRGVVERIGSFVRGMQVAEVSLGDRAGGPQVREVRRSDETTRRARPAPAQLQTELSQEREASGNVASEEEVSEQGPFRERSAEKTESGGRRNLPDEEEREGVGALQRQRKAGGSARTPTTREGGSVEKRKRVGGGDETPKFLSIRRRTGESSGKRSKSSRGKKADEGDSGEGDDDVEINLNAFNLDNAFFLEMQIGVQKNVVLHINPERILAIPDWEDAYNHQSSDEFLVDTIASAMIDCYERKDMRYMKPIFVLAPIVAPPENGEPAVRVPADSNSSHPKKYWYYPVCGQHNARATMMVKHHPVFDYYNFCKWPFRPIYFPDDEFDGYAHVNCEDNMKDKKNPPRLQFFQGLKKHVSYVKVDDPSLKRGRGKPKKGAEEKTFYVKVPEPYVHCWKELVDLTDREKKRLLNGVLNLNVVWVQTRSKKLAEQGKFSVKEMVDIIKMDRIMLRLWHYVEFENEEMDKQEWNANSTFFRSRKQLFEEFKDRGLNDKLWNESRKFFTDTTYVNKCPQFLGCQHDNNIKRTAALVNDQHFPAEWKRVVLSVITRDRAKGKKSPRGVDECINIMWTRTSALTTLAQFNVDPLSAKDHKEALGKLGHQLRSHTCVLDLCGTVDRAQWDSGAFASLSELLDIGGLRSLPVEPLLHDMFVCAWGYPMLHGEVGSKDDIEEDASVRKQRLGGAGCDAHPFQRRGSSATDSPGRGALYKDGKRNPNQLCNQLLFFCGVADVVLFLGKPHAHVVWSLLQQGRHVLVVDGDITQLEYTVQYVTHEVSSKPCPCDFHHVVVEPVYDPNKDMFFKLTLKKRRQVYSFLYDEQPRLRFDPQYVVRKEVAIAVLQGYHGASRAGAVSFIKRLEYVFFNEDVVDPTDFTLDKYKLAFGEEDDFNIETEQEESVEDDLFDLDGQLTIFNAQVSESLHLPRAVPSPCPPQRLSRGVGYLV
ncbi:hypothetical protein CBR_g54788 [Chara braunii]|uniref:Uncharacterized protein n=1 Tax=Chara braunii TaxID=69332 RepID=A0A388MCF2_CHABU|nr:hypothetical protein CBR_g54788 [Chara braunii]|eukprot:GBG92244.1 hypothetical protein CBR_g54788 [Chara braunii]